MVEPLVPPPEPPAPVDEPDGLPPVEPPVVESVEEPEGEVPVEPEVEPEVEPPIEPEVPAPVEPVESGVPVVDGVLVEPEVPVLEWLFFFFGVVVPVVPDVSEPVAPEDITSRRFTWSVSPVPEKLART